MDSKIYFEDYCSGKFQNQKTLCRITKEKGSSIETNGANPMTIRLLVAHDDLHIIKTLASKWKFVKDASGFNAFNNPSDAPRVSGALSYEVIVCPGKFDFIDVHKALFGFFSNLNSAMDRLAFEIAKLYEISDDHIYWSSFFGKKPTYSIPPFKKIVNDQNQNKINWAIECRHRLLHDGILSIEFEDEDSIRLPKCPRNFKCNHWEPMETACDSVFWEIIDTMDATYGTLFNEITAKGLPLRL